MPKRGTGFILLIDGLPYRAFVPLALILLLAPFKPMPHVVEKLRLFINGDLTRPPDVFDLLFHLLPTLLVALKSFVTFAIRHRLGGWS